MCVQTPTASCDQTHGLSNLQILCVGLGDSLVIANGDNAVGFTELEMRSARAAVRWRARSSSCLRTRFVLCIDNQASITVRVKDRSSSCALNTVARQVSVMLLCFLNRPLHAYTNTDGNCRLRLPSFECLAGKLRWSKESRACLKMTPLVHTVLLSINCEFRLKKS